MLSFLVLLFFIYLFISLFFFFIYLFIVLIYYCYYYYFFFLTLLTSFPTYFPLFFTVDVAASLLPLFFVVHIHTPSMFCFLFLFSCAGAADVPAVTQHMWFHFSYFLYIFVLVSVTSNFSIWFLVVCSLYYTFFVSNQHGTPPPFFFWWCSIYTLFVGVRWSSMAPSITLLNAHLSVSFYSFLFSYHYSPPLYWQHDGCRARGRERLPFRNTWFHSPILRVHVVILPPLPTLHTSDLRLTVTGFLYFDCAEDWFHGNELYFVIGSSLLYFWIVMMHICQGPFRIAPFVIWKSWFHYRVDIT